MGIFQAHVARIVGRINLITAIVALVQESEFAEWLNEDEVDCGRIVIHYRITDETKMYICLNFV